MMDSINRLQGEERESGIYRVAGLNPRDVMDVARTWEWSAWYVNVADVRSKGEFLSEVGRAMEFPSYFGKNWDAFEECLRDLPKAGGYILFIDNPSAIALAEPKSWSTTLSILENVSAFWRKQDAPFYVLLAHTRGAAPNVPLLD